MMHGTTNIKAREYYGGTSYEPTRLIITAVCHYYKESLLKVVIRWAVWMHFLRTVILVYVALFLGPLTNEIKRQYWYRRGHHLVPNAEWLLCVPSEPTWKLHILRMECADCTCFVWFIERTAFVRRNKPKHMVFVMVSDHENFAFLRFYVA